MAKRLFKLSLGPDAREYDLHGTRAFPCEIYETSMQSMISRHVPEHWHKEIEIGYVEKGRICLFCNDESYTLHEEDIYFLSSANRHSMKEKAVKSVFYSIVFHEDMVSGPDSINEKYLYPVFHDKTHTVLIFRERKILEHLKEIIRLGDEQVLDDGGLTGKVQGVTKALDLIGPRNLKDTLTAVGHGGIVCQTGILGGVYALNGFDPIKDIPNGVYLTGFFSNYPTKRIVDDMFQFFNEKKLVPIVGVVYDFEHIQDAVKAQDTGTVNGKIVVKT